MQSKQTTEDASFAERVMKNNVEKCCSVEELKIHRMALGMMANKRSLKTAEVARISKAIKLKLSEFLANEESGKIPQELVDYLNRQEFGEPEISADLVQPISLPKKSIHPHGASSVMSSPSANSDYFRNFFAKTLHLFAGGVAQN